MKKVSLSTAVLIGFVAASLQAGTEVYKQVAPPPPPVYGYGLGFYGAIDMGANVYQDRGGTRTFTGDNRINDITDRDFDATLEVNPKNDVGFFGGIKLGYVFGSGVVRPTIEGDFFYNGFRGGADFTLRDRFGDTIATAQRDHLDQYGRVHGELHLAIRTWKPKISAVCRRRGRHLLCRICGGRGRDPVTGSVPINTGGGASHADLAWQIIAGSDYFFNPKMSAFIEYKYPRLHEHPNQYPRESRSGSTPGRRGCSVPFFTNSEQFSLV